VPRAAQHWRRKPDAAGHEDDSGCARPVASPPTVGIPSAEVPGGKCGRDRGRLATPGEPGAGTGAEGSALCEFTAETMRTGRGEAFLGRFREHGSRLFEPRDGAGWVYGRESANPGSQGKSAVRTAAGGSVDVGYGGAAGGDGAAADQRDGAVGSTNRFGGRPSKSQGGCSGGIPPLRTERARMGHPRIVAREFRRRKVFTAKRTLAVLLALVCAGL